MTDALDSGVSHQQRNNEYISWLESLCGCDCGGTPKVSYMEMKRELFNIRNNSIDLK